jgi:hypothetical protein
MDWIFGRDVVVGLVWFCGYHEAMPLCEFFWREILLLALGQKGSSHQGRAGPSTGLIFEWSMGSTCTLLCFNYH